MEAKRPCATYSVQDWEQSDPGGTIGAEVVALMESLDVVLNSLRYFTEVGWRHRFRPTDLLPRCETFDINMGLLHSGNMQKVPSVGRPSGR